jgi:hypothetical protein
LDTAGPLGRLKFGGATLRMTSFGHFLDDFRGKGVQIPRIFGGYAALVYYHRRILPCESRIDHVGFDRFAGGRLSKKSLISLRALSLMGIV